MALKLKYDFTKPIWDDADDQIDAQKGPSLDVVRASTASVTDYSNVIKTVKANEPRFTGGRRVENTVKQSEDFSTTWTVSSTTSAVVGNEVIAPDGTLTADLLVDDGSEAAANEVFVTQTIPPVIGGQHTYSVYAKANGQDWLSLYARSFTSPPNSFTHFDLANGVVGQLSASHDASGIEAASVTISGAPDGWYRCWVTWTVGTTGAGTLRIYSAPSDGALNSDLDGTSSCYLWGAQVENVSGQDDPSPSEYIATTTAAVSKWYATKRRTNLLKQSEDLNAAGVWTVVSVGSGNTVHNADGSAIFTSVASGDREYSTQIFANLKIGETYTFSANIVSNDGGWNRGNIAVQVPNTNYIATSSGGRESVTFVATQASTTFRVGIGCLSGETAQTSGSITISEVQLECGSTATAYIPTTTTVASSAFDTAITPTGLLVEEARTNICLQSEDFSTTWVEAGNALAVVGDETTAPDGTTTADKLIDDSSTGTGAVAIYQNKTVASGTHTFSCYVKADGLDWVDIRSLGFDATGDGETYFDLTNGAVGTSSANHATSIEDAGNGWYRCAITFTTTTDLTGDLYLYVAEADNDRTIDLDGTSSIFVWGAQLEAGAFPTSYIPTVAASVTRAADDISTTDVSWFNGITDTWYIKARTADITGARRTMINMWGTGNTRDADIYVGGSDIDVNRDETVSMNSTGSPVNNTDFEVVVGFAENDCIVYMDGASGASDVSTAALTKTATQLRLGYYATAADLNGHIAEIRYYNERLDNTALENMSNGIFPTTGGKSGPSLAFGGMGKMGLRS